MTIRIARPHSGLWLVPTVAVVAVVLRCIGLDHRGLWYDELLSANFSRHGPLASFLTVVRFDVHPPLYYEQLSLWSRFGQSDGWLMANSILWSVAAPVTLAVGVARLYGRATGLWAGLLLAASPAALTYSDQVRMYPMIMTMIVGIWFAQALWLARPRLTTGLLLALLETSLVYSHTIGVIMLSGCVVLGGVTILLDGGGRRLWTWLAIQTAVGLSALPVLVVDVSRNVGHIPPLSLADVASTWSLLTTGACIAHDYALSCGLGLSAATVLIAAAFFCLFTVLVVVAPGLRLDILTLIAVPLVIIGVVSLTIKPVWLDRVFVVTIPFFALVLARLAADPALRISTDGATVSPEIARAAAPAFIVILWIGLGVVEQFKREKTDGYSQAAAYVSAVAHPGDAVEMADKAEFWAFMWRFAGPDWGDPLHSYVASPSWARLTAKAPAALRARLSATRLCIPVGPREAILLSSDQPCAEPRGDVFTVGLSDETFAPPGRVLSERHTFPPLVVQRWRRIN